MKICPNFFGHSLVEQTWYVVSDLCMEFFYTEIFNLFLFVEYTRKLLYSKAFSL